ncbi:MAG: hypothetical protein QFB87_02875 [Patescibacteria group bacterium]|nr:hypothetical protein [Patescibacteria group bacterium]
MRLASITKSEINEPVWHVVGAIIIAIGLQLLLKKELVFSSKYAVAGLEVILLAVVAIPAIGARLKRLFAFGLIGLVTLANLVSLGLVVKALLSSGSQADGHQLLLSSVAIYLTNIIVFGVLYWELDGTSADEPDFQFTQFSSDDAKDKRWRPTFFDYVYVSITNATAFSPTDTMPLTHRAKLLMSLQSLIALVTVALVAARAVNILGS